MKMFALYNLSKDLIRKEAYFEVGSILEDLFQIKHEHDDVKYQDSNVTVYHRFYHGHAIERDKFSTRYKYRGELHRKSRPAVITRDEDGNEIREEYWLNGKLHRGDDDEPTIINYDKQGKVISCGYTYYHTLHQYDGPAFVSYNY